MLSTAVTLLTTITLTTTDGETWKTTAIETMLPLHCSSTSLEMPGIHIETLCNSGRNGEEGEKEKMGGGVMKREGR